MTNDTYFNQLNQPRLKVLPARRISDERQFIADLRVALNAGHQAQVRWWPHTDHDNALLEQIKAMGPNVAVFRN